ncbi:hypothetical protein SME36J_43210 [Serratia marcescens]|nr:hypothetical protein SME36J_43210 [Serratia marcescens]
MKISMLLTLFPLLMPASVLASTVQSKLFKALAFNAGEATITASSIGFILTQPDTQGLRSTADFRDDGADGCPIVNHRRSGLPEPYEWPAAGPPGKNAIF